MPSNKWARVRLSGAHNLRRGAWYPVVNDSNPSIVILDVSKNNVPVPRDSLHLASEKPDAWSVVKYDPSGPIPPRISQQNLPLTYAVCAHCRARSVELDEGTTTLRCQDCGNEAAVDWENPS